MQTEVENTKTKLFSKGFLVKSAVLMVLLFLFYVCYQRAESVEPMKAFDPFKILDISTDATKAEIKKAFRKKSLETHPDKNPDDPLAASKFLQVTRAHQALTDDDAIENYRKYGNPDGPGPMKVAIGLPYFLMKKEYQILSLCVSFLFILIIIPSLFLFWYSGSYSYTDKGLKQEDDKAFAAAINEQMAFMDMPKLIGWASDFDHIKIRNKEELEYLMKLNKDVLNNKGPIINPQKGGVMKNYKPHLLTMLYMFRANNIPEQYQKEIRDIVEKVPSLIDLWLELSMMFHMQYRMKRIRKNMTFKAMSNIIVFAQHVVQGIWENDSQLLQLPYMDADRISKIAKKMKKKEITLKEYVSLTKEERHSHEAFNEQELKVVEHCIENLPNIKVIPEVITEGSEDIVVHDIVSIKVKIHREELKENERAQPVCSRTYPTLKTEKFYVYLTDLKDDGIFAYIQFTGTEKEQEKVIKFQAPPNMIGECKMRVHCFSDSYVGLDSVSEFSFTIKQESQTRSIFSYHEEDIKREPTLFEQVLQGMNEENSDDDLESDDDADTANATFDSKKSQAKENPLKGCQHGCQHSDEEVEDEKDD